MFAKPGVIGYISIFNKLGVPIVYTTVAGKITSSSKRLTSPDEVKDFCSADSCMEKITAPNDDGTFGSSDPYIYFLESEWCILSDKLRLCLFKQTSVIFTIS